MNNEEINFMTYLKLKEDFEGEEKITLDTPFNSPLLTEYNYSGKTWYDRFEFLMNFFDKEVNEIFTKVFVGKKYETVVGEDSEVDAEILEIEVPGDDYTEINLSCSAAGSYAEWFSIDLDIDLHLDIMECETPREFLELCKGIDPNTRRIKDLIRDKTEELDFEWDDYYESLNKAKKEKNKLNEEYDEENFISDVEDILNDKLTGLIIPEGEGFPDIEIEANSVSVYLRFYTEYYVSFHAGKAFTYGPNGDEYDGSYQVDANFPLDQLFEEIPNASFEEKIQYLKDMPEEKVFDEVVWRADFSIED